MYQATISTFFKKSKFILFKKGLSLEILLSKRSSLPFNRVIKISAKLSKFGQ